MHGFLILERGAGIYSDSQGLTEAVEPGAVILLFPGLRHEYGPGPGQRWEESFLDAGGPLMELLEVQGVLDRKQPVCRPPSSSISPLRRLIADVEHDRIHDPREAQWRLHGAILTLCRDPVADAAGLAAGHACIRAQVTRPLDVTAAAAAAGMSVETFRKRYRDLYGLPPARARMHARCEAVAESLLAPGATLEHLAETFGFCDAAHLRRHFRKVFGLAPDEFRRLHGVEGTRAGAR